MCIFKWSLRTWKLQAHLKHISKKNLNHTGIRSRVSDRNTVAVTRPKSWQMTHSSTPATRMLPTTASLDFRLKPFLGNQSDGRWTEQSTYRGRPSHPRMKDFPTDIVSLLLWCNPAAPLGGTWKLIQSCQFDLFHWISETGLDGVRLGRGWKSMRCCQFSMGLRV